jgi:hypothetical protein
MRYLNLPRDEHDDSVREDERRRTYARWRVGVTFVLFLVVSAFLLGVWLQPKLVHWTRTGGGFFWPVWIIVALFVLFVVEAWDADL